LVEPGGRLLARSVPASIRGPTFRASPGCRHAEVPRKRDRRRQGSQRALGAYGIRIDPKLNWFFFVEQPLSQAFAPIYDMLMRILWLLALGLILAFAAGLLLARRMVVSDSQASGRDTRVGANEFGHHIDVRTGDEVEELADQFTEWRIRFRIPTRAWSRRSMSARATSLNRCVS